MVPVLAARVLVEVATHRRLGVSRELAAVAFVDAAHHGEWVRDQIGVCDVDELSVAVLVAPTHHPLDELHRHVGPVTVDVRAVISVAERARQRPDQAAE